MHKDHFGCRSVSAPLDKVHNKFVVFILGTRYTVFRTAPRARAFQLKTVLVSLGGIFTIGFRSQLLSNDETPPVGGGC